MNTMQQQPLTLGVRVYVPHDFDGPACAAVALTPDFLADVERLRRVVVDHHLHRATLWTANARWGEQAAARGEYWNVRDAELTVTERGFYLVGVPKHCDYAVETRLVEHGALERLLAASAAGADAVFSECERADLIRGGLVAPEGAIMATFQPQQWVMDNATASAPAQQVDVTRAVLACDLGYIRSLQDNRDETDALVDSAALGHDGPFYVTVRDAIAAYFAVDDAEDISQEMLDAARAAHGMATPAV